MTDSPPSRAIRFYHRGAVREVRDAAPTRSVLDWLREDARCTGTKEGCNEGDCGACTVVVAQRAAADDPNAVRGLALRTVNACIQFLPTLDGKALFTVEDLRELAGPTLHPVQQAMVECHGSQCGFCTPGFVMSLWSVYERHTDAPRAPTRQQLADELSGNLCRCTGYRPILDAGQRMFELPTVALDTAAVLEALDRLHLDGPLTYRDPTTADRFFAPRTVDELAALRVAWPRAQLLAGGTDVGLWVNKQFRALGDILYVGDVAQLQCVQSRPDELYIGAGASLERAWSSLAQRHPELTEVWLRFAAPPIRNAGTMGGNVANGSPIGDSAPVLIALDAQIELRQGPRVRRMPLEEFYVDYMTNRLEAAEFVQAVAVPTPSATLQVRAYKISKRFDCDISALCAALAIELDGSTVRSVRLVFGGMAATVRRAARAEACLLGQTWDSTHVERAQQALAEDYTPLSDMRASSGYRLQVARNLLRRFWLETRAHDALPSAKTSVWSVMPHEPAHAVTSGATS